MSVEILQGDCIELSGGGPTQMTVDDVLADIEKSGASSTTRRGGLR